LRRTLGSLAEVFTGSMGSGDQSSRRSDRRWAPRYAFRANLEIEWGSAVLRASTRDISSNGMFIESPDPLWIGAGFTARLVLDRPVKVDCSVRRIEPGLGMGVAVTLSEGGHEQRYQDLLASLSNTGS
jgi:PilZ domain